MLKSVLARLLQVGGRLHTNQLARHLYNEILVNNNFIVEKRKDCSNTEMYFGKDSPISLSDIINYPNTDSEIPPISVAEAETKDYRFTKILINGIKKIPAEESYKRLIFSENKNYVTSAVIMGNNGVGKSSFYGSLEFIGMGQMKTAELYGIDTKTYLKNHFAVDQEAKAILHTVSDTLHLNFDQPAANCVPAFFISEWDIREMEKLSDCGDFIFSQLGMENFRNLIRLLNFSCEKLESAKVSYDQILAEEAKLGNKVETLKTLLLGNIISNKPPVEEELKEYWELYHKDHEALLKDLLDSNQTLVNYTSQKASTEEYKTLSKINNWDREIGQLKELISVLSTEFNNIITKWIERILNPLLTKLLSEYLRDEGESIELIYDDNTQSIVVKLELRTNDGNNGETNPRKYFNTFRFKIFVVSLKIALACCAKIIYKRNWPIVIDDVFNSSDFNNRTRMGEYISRICKEYRNIQELAEMKFQLIIFTQDDVIGEAVYRGLSEEDMDVRFIRLHDYRCFEKIKPTIDGDIKYIDIDKEIESYRSKDN